MVEVPLTRQDVFGALVAGTLALSFVELIDAVPALADTIAILAAILIGAAMADHLDHCERGNWHGVVEAVVATAIVRQTLRRLDDQQRQRAFDDAERELISEWDLDIEFNREALVEDAERPLEDVLNN